MRHRAIPDRSRAGRSSVVPFNPDEDAGLRHARRKATNLQAVDDVGRWCEARGIRCLVSNEGHHWQFGLPNGKLVEWWPSSAKLVVNKQWSRGIHVHDYQQAQKIIEREATCEPS